MPAPLTKVDRPLASARHRLAVAGAVALMAGSCGWDVDPMAVRSLGPDPTTFTGALAGLYLELAEEEAGEGDWSDAEAFFELARRAALGEEIAPQAIEARDLSPEIAAEAEAQRALLVNALDRGGRLFVPAQAAAAQTLFDCWLQEAEEDRQPRDIADCRNQFEVALEALIEATRGDILLLLPDLDGSVGEITIMSETETVTLSDAGSATLVGQTAPAPRPPVAMDERTVGLLFGDALAAQPEPPERFILYFQTGGTELTPESEAMLADIEVEIMSRVAPNLTVVGHTDTVGPAALNARLAVRRATIVQELLVGRGVSAGSIEATSYGESLLLVPTADNVDEPRNRRVEVIVR